jgi:MoaA/NifB/PqqE/SkfB family radical SAM enzyme
MQKPSILLKEIIWEITGRCNNRCKFCGSKEVWNEPIEEDTILEIARRIVSHDDTIPEEIDISGGDPLLVSYDCHKELIRILKSENVLCKIVINPKSAFKEYSVLKDKLDILNMYDHVGISINTPEEAKNFGDLVGMCNSTVITNFNLQNVFIFNMIHDLVKNHNVPWMVQFTMYKENNPLALYNDENEEALNELNVKINLAKKEGTRIVVSDNANPYQCSAGTRSLGILNNGDVVGCLSMRCWEDKMNVVGNILRKGLNEIWKNRFQEYRFGYFKCCKDHCKNKLIQIEKESLYFFYENGKEIVSDNPFYNERKLWEQPIDVQVYGVVSNISYHVPKLDSGIKAVYGVIRSSGDDEFRKEYNEMLKSEENRKKEKDHNI